MPSVVAPVNDTSGMCRKEDETFGKTVIGNGATAGIMESKLLVDGRLSYCCMHCLPGLAVVVAGNHILDRRKIGIFAIMSSSHDVPSSLSSMTASASLPLGDLDRLRSTGCDLTTGGDVVGGEPGPS